MSRFAIYLIGVAGLGFATAFLKTNLSGLVYLIVCIVYLISLRLVADRFGTRQPARHGGQVDPSEN